MISSRANTRTKPTKQDGDDRFLPFQQELFYRWEGEHQVNYCQRVALRLVRLICICSRNNKDFHEGCYEPGAHPWFLIEAVTVFVRQGGNSFGNSANNLILHFVSDGEVFCPVRLEKDKPQYRQKHGPIARMSLVGYGAVSWELFGPGDQKLVQQVIAGVVG